MSFIIINHDQRLERKLYESIGLYWIADAVSNLDLLDFIDQWNILVFAISERSDLD